MLLRSLLEKHVPLKEGEEPLTRRAARAVAFRGSYIKPGLIIGVEILPNYDSESNSGIWPWQVFVTRQHTNGSVSQSRPLRNNLVNFTISEDYRDPREGVNQLQRQEAINRANRIERIARKVKIIVAGSALTGASLAAGLLTGSVSSAEVSTPTVSVPYAEYGVPSIQSEGLSLSLSIQPQDESTHLSGASLS